MGDRSLVVFFSYSGNTRRLAKRIQTQCDGDLFELLPVVPYPMDYGAVVKQAKREIREGYLPDLEGLPKEIGEYSHIYVGTPNWLNTMAPPLAAFLSLYDCSDMEIDPFCTHGGGGPGRIQMAVRQLCPRAKIGDCLAVGGSRA